MRKTITRKNRTTKLHKCAICGCMFAGYGNNPLPVRSRGRACNDCDATVVIPMRLRIMLNY